MTRDGGGTRATANTLGNIAGLYGVGVAILNDWISGYPELEESINNYCKNARHKNAKVLPPKIIEDIFTKLGKP